MGSDEHALFPIFDRSLYIDFDAMTLRGPSADLAVRRLSSLSYNQIEDVGWYYKDNSYWCEYGVQVRDIFVHIDAHLLQRTLLVVKFQDISELLDVIHLSSHTGIESQHVIDKQSGLRAAV